MIGLKNGNLIVKLDNDEGVDNNDEAKSVNTMPSLFGSYILSYSQGLENDVFKHIGGFHNISIYNTDTISLYI